MKSSLALVIVSLLTAATLRGAGTLPTYDGLAYDVGFDIGSQSTNTPSGFKWSHTGTAVAGRSTTINVASGSLSYPGLATSVGNSIATPGPNSEGLRYHAGLSGTANLANPIYYSVLFQISSLGSLGTGGVALFSLNNSSTTNQTTDPTSLPGRIWVRLSATAGKFNVGITSGYNSSGQPTPTWSATDFNPGDTLFVVLKYNMVSGSSSIAYALIDPSPSDLSSATIDLGTATTPSTTVTNNQGTQASGVQSMLVMNVSASYPTFSADEVRMGTTFASVAPGGPPGFTNPLPATLKPNYGSMVVLNPGPAGPGTLTYQWMKDGTSLSDGNGYSGVTTPILTLTNITAAQSGGYALTATSTPYGSSISTTSAVSVVDPAINAQPQPLTLPPGADAVFSVGAAGSGTVTYQWQKGGVGLSNGPTGTGSTIAGSTTATLTVHNIGPSDADNYSVLVGGAGPSVLSSNASLTVIDPAITSNPTNVTVNYNVNAAFHVTAAGSGPFTYQWLDNGVPLTDGTKYPGYNTANLTVNGPTYLDAGNYQVIVTNHLGNSATSAVATLTVNDPFFLSPPSPVTAAVGGSASFAVSASGSTALTYQWYVIAGGVTNAVSDVGDITGSATDTLTITNLATTADGNYFIVVTGGQSITSAPVALVVVAPPVITVPLQSRTVLAGDRVVFIATVTGTSPLSYTWTKNGGAPLAVPSVNHLVLSNVVSADTGLYTMVVSNFAGRATNSAALTVASPPLQLAPTNLSVLRVGDGLQTLSLDGNSAYLDQFTAGGTYVNTVSIPEAGPNAFVMIGGGSTFTDCQMTRSMDGRLLCLPGYATNLNYGFSLSSASSTAVPRAIYTVNGSGVATLAKSSTTAYNSQTFRSAASDGANNFWGSAGNGGTYYFGNGGNPATTIQNTVTNSRVVNIFNGNLYFTEAQAGDQSLWMFSGLPVTAATPTKLLTVGNLGTPSPMAFAVSPNTNIIYIADDRSNGSGGIFRYDFDTNALSYQFSYVLGTGVANVGARGLTVDWSGTNPVIYATTAETSHNRIITITDTDLTAPATTLVTAGDNQLFRSIAFGPVASVNPVLLAISSAGNQVTLAWVDPSSSFRLEAKTNLTDTAWTTVTNSPTVNNGTNSVTLPLNSASKFFRLHYP